MQFKRRRELRKTKIEIIPMIDTIFFLLVFFMLSSLSLTHLRGFRVDLPSAATARSESVADVTLTIDKEQNLFLNKEPITLEGLGQRLLGLVGSRAATATFVINADKVVPHGLVVRCIDASQAVGITHFAIATEAEALEKS